MQKEQLLLIAYFIIVVLALIGVVVFIFIVFQRRKNRLLIERMEAQQRFQQELAGAQLEIQEQTLKNIAWELHDNIGQLLAVTNMQLSLLERSADEGVGQKIRESKETVGTAINELRSLSRTLNSEVVSNNGLLESIKTELDRFNRLKFLEARLQVTGQEITLESSDEILIFRIFQEFFSNVIKHAQATELNVDLEWLENGLKLSARDNGVGFDTAKKQRSSGLQNMKSRAKLLGAALELISEPGKGSEIRLTYHK
jgi:signal transduction histidine kinase